MCTHLSLVFEGPPPPPGQLCEGEDSKLELWLCHHFHQFLSYVARIYHRRGARRWKKVRRINDHPFVAKRFQLAYCDFCGDRIWGLGRQGYRCELCRMTVHKRCCYFLKHDDTCKGHPVSVDCFVMWLWSWLSPSSKVYCVGSFQKWGAWPPVCLTSMLGGIAEVWLGLLLISYTTTSCIAACIPVLHNDCILASQNTIWRWCCSKKEGQRHWLLYWLPKARCK